MRPVLKAFLLLLGLTLVVGAIGLWYFLTSGVSGLWPKAPDMRLPQTQNLSDGELFWIIENGIRFTGMPGWSTGTTDGETGTWHLVHFIRRLPRLTPEELAQMETLNPKPPDEIRQQIEEEEFLKGGGEKPPAAPATPHKHPGLDDSISAATDVTSGLLSYDAARRPRTSRSRGCRSRLARR